MKLLLPVAFLAGVCAMSVLTKTADPPVELGAVQWERDLEAAKQISADSGKPVLVLFQEVPG